MSHDTVIRDSLRSRAQTLALIRAFFAEREVTEVQTPALSKAATTDPALASLSVDVASLHDRYYLQTSPEFAMKRLLAEGSGDIYQIARVYRDGELGRWHQPEFVLLEWYRTGFDEFELMNEVFDLLKRLLEIRIPNLTRHDISYQTAFRNAFGIEPLALDDDGHRRLGDALRKRGIDVPEEIAGDGLLDLALGTVISADWPHDTAIFLYDYPASQAALAAVKNSKPPVAARFEVFLNGLELGNGFRELTDATEQRKRFEADLAVRRKAGMPAPPIDSDFLLALERGLPECAGVAIGIDRLIALVTGAESLADAITFAHA